MKSIIPALTHRSNMLRLAILVLSFTLTSGLNLVSAADDIDVDPPLIAFDPVEEGVLGDSQVFTVFISDDGALQDVYFYYRLVSEDSARSPTFARVLMSQFAGTDIHTHTLSASDIGASTTRIEYYIQATDRAGNLALEGFSFDPLTRTLASDTRLAGGTSPATATPEVGISSSRKWIYGALGVLVVGALISAAGDDDGGNGGGSLADDTGVNVTVTVDPLPGS